MSARYVDDEAKAALAVLDRANEDQLRRIARVMLEECGYLDQHNPPQGSHQFGRFPCSEDTYHLCSFTLRHDPGCRAAGGNGDVSANGYAHARSCEPDCAEGEPEAWCNVAGFDCPTCETLTELRAVVAEIARVAA